MTKERIQLLEEIGFVWAMRGGENRTEYSLTETANEPISPKGSNEREGIAGEASGEVISNSVCGERQRRLKWQSSLMNDAVKNID